MPAVDIPISHHLLVYHYRPGGEGGFGGLGGAGGLGGLGGFGGVGLLGPLPLSSGNEPSSCLTEAGVSSR